jgi:hypothetical protein
MKNIGTEIKWAIIFTIVAMAWMVFEKLMGWHDEHIAQHYIYTNFFTIVAITIYVLALLNKRNSAYGGKMTYKQGFISGCILSIIIMILVPLSQFVTHKYITPDYFNNMIAYTVEEGILTKEAALSQFNLTSYIIQSAIFAPVVGVVTSAVVAIFVKKR